MSDICIVGAATANRHPDAHTDIHIPCERLVWIGVEPPPKATSNCSGFSRDIVRRQWTLAGPQVGPALLNFRKLHCMKSLCLNWVASA